MKLIRVADDMACALRQFKKRSGMSYRKMSTIIRSTSLRIASWANDRTKLIEENVRLSIEI